MFCARYLPFALPDPLFPFLYPALCPGRLTCIDHINRLPCPLTPPWVQPIEPWQKMKGKEESEVGGVCLPDSFSKGSPLGWIPPPTEVQWLLSEALAQTINFLLPGSANYPLPSPFYLGAVIGLPHPPPLHSPNVGMALSV